MIVGNGLIANLFKNDDIENVVFFASGVSNSLETEKSAFLREENLLRKHLTENPEKIFIYFSTCSIYDSSKNGSLYVNHKLKMERLVEELAKKYVILSLDLPKNYIAHHFSGSWHGTWSEEKNTYKNLVNTYGLMKLFSEIPDGKANVKNVVYNHQKMEIDQILNQIPLSY